MKERTTNTTYGRKVIKEAETDYVFKRIVISWVICIVIGLVIGAFGFWGISTIVSAAEPEIVEPTTEIVEESTKIVESIEPTIPEEPEEPGFIPLNVPLDEDIQKYVNSLCEEYGVEFNLAMALIFTESSFRADAKSGTSDFGLMQINKINHEWLSKELGITDFLDPYQNIKAGMYILGGLHKKYDNMHRILMSYNMGEGGARKAWNNGVYCTDYSNKILNKSVEYKNYIEERRNEKCQKSF